MIVLDASVALDVLLVTPRGRQFSDRIIGHERHAPYLLDIEFAQTLRRLNLAGKITRERARLALDTFSEFALVRHSHVHFLPRIWELRTGLSAYDAAYVALAESLEMPLFTFDAKLARSHGHQAEIVLLDVGN